MTQTEPLTITLAATGLNLGYTVLNIDRTVYAAFATTGMVEVGGGVYAVAGGVVVPDAGGYIQVYKAPAGTEFVGEAAVRSTSANVTYSAGVELGGRLAEASDIPGAIDVSDLALEATVQAILVRTGLIMAGGSVTAVAPVASDGATTVYQGDDYAATDGRALEWSAATWPDLTNATMHLMVRAQTGALFSKAGTVVSAGGATQTIRVELTDDETALLEAWPAAAAAAQSAVESALLLGAQAALADLGDIGLGIAFDLRNPRAVAYLRDKGAALVTQINETTRQEMRDLIVRMVEERASYDQVAREISRRWAEMAIPKPQGHIDSRAHLIAVTEVGQAYEQGNLAAVQDMASLGLAMEKSWLTVGDDRVSDGCAENEGAGWIPLDEPFPSGDDRPLRFPGCRCTALYRRVGSG